MAVVASSLLCSLFSHTQPGPAIVLLSRSSTPICLRDILGALNLDTTTGDILPAAPRRLLLGISASLSSLRQDSRTAYSTVRIRTRAELGPDTYTRRTIVPSIYSAYDTP